MCRVRQGSPALNFEEGGRVDSAGSALVHLEGSGHHSKPGMRIIKQRWEPRLIQGGRTLIARFWKADL